MSESSTCQSCLALLVDYVDGQLPDDVRAKLESHFHDCQPCEDFLATYRATASVCRKALERTIPESVAAKLHAFIRDELCNKSKA
ncbi:MAG: zf-HC2 domain-containing protein [Myxococcaceae bacterium]|nr:zf-HC2 domain-containing protein [Myxococcaceae bacterium]